MFPSESVATPCGLLNFPVSIISLGTLGHPSTSQTSAFSPQPAHQVVVDVENDKAGVEFGDYQAFAIHRESAWEPQEVFPKPPFVVALQVVDLDAVVAAVGDIQLGFGLAGIHEDYVRTSEPPGVAFFTVHAAHVLSVFGMPMDVGLTVAVGYPNVASPTVFFLEYGHRGRRVIAVILVDWEVRLVDRQSRSCRPGRS